MLSYACEKHEHKNCTGTFTIQTTNIFTSIFKQPDIANSTIQEKICTCACHKNTDFLSCPFNCGYKCKHKEKLIEHIKSYHYGNTKPRVIR